MEVWLALFLPFLLMVVITRVTFSLIGASIVTWMVLIFATGVHEKSWILIVITVLSFAIGLMISNRRLRVKQGM
ncbi:DUF2198 family protein [Bacillus solitudinis]|uniref:DUF2198 family protein n=1 Tax=Bacillus solitudinis TaxID=2014074 RepID=UPI000C24830F|nr:DUF2198 family protein [Bacillus solitudinis]